MGRPEDQPEYHWVTHVDVDDNGGRWSVYLRFACFKGFELFSDDEETAQKLAEMLLLSQVEITRAGDEFHISVISPRRD